MLVSHHLHAAPVVCPDPAQPFEQELIDSFAIVLGQARANHAVCGFVQMINDQAGKGAQKSVLPILIPTVVVSALGLGLAIFAVARTRKR